MELRNSERERLGWMDDSMVQGWRTMKGNELMKRLPIGIQTFRDIVQNDYLYVDKTDNDKLYLS